MDAISWYRNNINNVAACYESLRFEDIHNQLLNRLPDKPLCVLDIGAGTGRDAAWLAEHGHQVMAVEPSAEMRKEGQKRHPNPSIRWLDDRLPSLAQTFQLGIHFDIILLSAVWMHIAPFDRMRAFRKMVLLLKPGGCLFISLRYGPAEPERFIYTANLEEVESLARQHGAYIEQAERTDDKIGRTDVYWMQVIIRLPDDGVGALPLLRHVILNDAKSSTYKLALLRTLCRIADGSTGSARAIDDDAVLIPLGLVGLYWLRLFLPLIKADLPQSPDNQNGTLHLGFAKEAFGKLISSLSPNDLRVGMRYNDTITIKNVHRAIRDACAIIKNMPANYITYPNGKQILETNMRTNRIPSDTLTLDIPYLFSFGEMRVPQNLWLAFQRFDAWIEPALIAEWIRLMNSYSASQNRTIDPAQISLAMAWDDPKRDVSLARDRALSLLEAGELRCVWSDKKLTTHSLDVDHCFPWLSWPCGDLWNLLPAERNVNQHQKRNRLPAANILHHASGRIINWWRQAYVNGSAPILTRRFMNEATATLPGLSTIGIKVELEDICEAMHIQRTRLQQMQQIPEWVTIR